MDNIVNKHYPFSIKKTSQMVQYESFGLFYLMGILSKFNAFDVLKHRFGIVKKFNLS